MTTRLQDTALELTSLEFSGVSLLVTESPDGTITVILPDGGLLSFDENGLPPCVEHEVFDCPDINCQIMYALDDALEGL